jgi:polyhydroxybutyrate depolymerase
MGRKGRLLLAVVLVVAVAWGIGGGQSHAVAKRSRPSSCAPGRPAKAGTAQRTLQQGALQRSYLLTIPKRYNGRRAAPLVLNLHGFGGNGESQNAGTDLAKLAGDRGYVVAAPDGR